MVSSKQLPTAVVKVRTRKPCMAAAAASAVGPLVLSFVLRANVLREESSPYRQIDTCHTHSLTAAASPTFSPPGEPSTFPRRRDRCCRCRAGPPPPPSFPRSPRLSGGPRRGMSQATSLLRPEARQGKPACLAWLLPAWRGKVSARAGNRQQSRILFPPSFPPSLRVNGEKRRGVDGVRAL